MMLTSHHSPFRYVVGGTATLGVGVSGRGDIWQKDSGERRRHMGVVHDLKKRDNLKRGEGPTSGAVLGPKRRWN